MEKGGPSLIHVSVSSVTGDILNESHVALQNLLNQKRIYYIPWIVSGLKSEQLQ